MSDEIQVKVCDWGIDIVGDIGTVERMDDSTVRVWKLGSGPTIQDINARRVIDRRSEIPFAGHEDDADAAAQGMDHYGSLQ